MNTEIIDISPNNPEKILIKKAAEFLKNGGLCVIPTETVYGLAANGLSAESVNKIFEAKGRPQDNPLILHVSSIEMISQFVTNISEKAQILIKEFMPGPLSLIFPKSAIIPNEVTAGLQTVAVRMPANKIALELINECGFPLAAPSANISGKPSPTSIEHVIDDLYGKVDCIINGGPTNIGIESTVLDLTTNPPQLLRPGNITLNMLEEVAGLIEVPTNIKEVRSPGMKYKHYSPNAKVLLAKTHNELMKLAEDLKQINVPVGLITDEPTNDFEHTFLFDSCEHLAANLFSVFRKMDKKHVQVIIVKEVEENGLGVAIMNRLRKAANII